VNSAIVLSRAATGWLFSKNLTDNIVAKRDTSCLSHSHLRHVILLQPFITLATPLSETLAQR